MISHVSFTWLLGVKYANELSFRKMGWWSQSDINLPVYCWDSFFHTLHEKRSPCHVINVIHASFPWQSHRLNAPCAITAGRTNFRGRSALEEQTSKYLTTLLHTMDTMVCFAPSCTLPIFHGVIYVYNCLYVFCNFNMKWSLDLFSIQQMMISSNLFRQALSETCKQFFPKWMGLKGKQYKKRIVCTIK